jgi:hypothetical protein
MESCELKGSLYCPVMPEKIAHCPTENLMTAPFTIQNLLGFVVPEFRHEFFFRDIYSISN